MKSGLFLLLPLLLIGCTKKESSSISIKDAITLNTNKSEVLEKGFSSFVSIKKIIELKNVNPDDFVNSINKVFTDDAVFFVFNKLKSNILVFDEKGNYITKIGKRGNAPGEYKRIFDFTINTTKNEVYIAASDNMSIMVYDYSGKFLRKIQFESFFPKYISLIGDDLLISTGNANEDCTDLLLLDSAGKIKERYFSYPKEKEYYCFDYSGGINNKSTLPLYQESLSSIIYSFENQKIKAKYTIDLGDGQWPEDKRYNHADFAAYFNKTIGTDLLSYPTNNYIENNSFFVFNFINQKEYFGYYNKKAKHLYTSKTSFKEYQLSRFISVPVGIASDNSFVSSLSPELYHIISKSNTEFKDDLKKLNKELAGKLANSNPESNPLLIIYDFKE